MSYTVTAWARGKHRTTGELQAVRLQIIRPDHDINEEYSMRGDVSGFYRVNYGAWADEVGSNAENSEGESPRPHPPGKLNAAGDGYTVPDEYAPEDDDEAPTSPPPPK